MGMVKSMIEAMTGALAGIYDTPAPGPCVWPSNHFLLLPEALTPRLGGA